MKKVQEHNQRAKTMNFDLTKLEIAYISYFSRKVRIIDGKIYNNEIKYSSLPTNYDEKLKQTLQVSETEYQRIKWSVRNKGYLSFGSNSVFVNKDITVEQKLAVGQSIF